MSGIRDISASKIRLLADESIVGPLTTQKILSVAADYGGNALKYTITNNVDNNTPTVCPVNAITSLGTGLSVAAPVFELTSTTSRPLLFQPVAQLIISSPVLFQLRTQGGLFNIRVRVNFLAVGAATPNAAAGITIPMVIFRLAATPALTPSGIVTATSITPVVTNAASWSPSSTSEANLSLFYLVPRTTTTTDHSILLTAQNLCTLPISAVYSLQVTSI